MLQHWKRYFTLTLALLLGAATIQVQADPAAYPPRSVAPTYSIFATREGLVGYQTANGHIIQPRDRFVALPSWKALASYQGYEFQVRLTYNGRSVVVPVWDVGPWNTNDNYWDTGRTYSDLPVGIPMAQAAYLDGYNGGLDEFGRRIQSPNGIDIADGTFWDDLGMSRNDWVQVTFLWQGEDPGPGNAIPITPRPIVPAVPAAPDVPAVPAPAPGPVDSPRVADGATAVDNSDGGYASRGDGWEQANCGLNGSHVWTTSTSDPAGSKRSATWTPALPQAGFYEVKAYIPPCGGDEATREARYTITHAGKSTEVTINQAAASGTWVSLGTYRFSGESGQQIALSDLAGDQGRAVHFDAIAWEPRNDTIAPEATITAIIRERNGYIVQWGGQDDVSGIASYDVQVRQLPKGGWRDWKIETSLTEAWFGPDEGKHFAFRVRARDELGNEQPWPEVAEMDTTQAEGLEPTPVPPPEPEPTSEPEP